MIENKWCSHYEWNVANREYNEEINELKLMGHFMYDTTNVANESRSKSMILAIIIMEGTMKQYVTPTRLITA